MMETTKPDINKERWESLKEIVNAFILLPFPPEKMGAFEMLVWIRNIMIELEGQESPRAIVTDALNELGNLASERKEDPTT